MALDFPDAPAINDIFITPLHDFIWRGDRWQRTVSPLPVLTALVPATAYIITDVLVEVQGTGFHSASVVRFDGAPLATTFVSSTKLNVTAYSDVVKTAQVDVVNGADVSNELPFVFTVGPPTGPPIVDSVMPTGGWNNWTAAVITIYGGGFHPTEAVATWDGADQVTTFIAANQISFVIDCTTEALGLHTIGAKNGAFVATNTIQWQISN